jgi:type VI secretion system protein ImpA
LAALKTEGLPGLCQGLELLAGLLQKHWDSLYPALDVEDGDDPTMRINAIESIAAPLGNVEDPWRFVLAVHQTALLRSRQLGNIPVGTLLAAKGLALPWPGFPVLEVAAAEGVLRELPALEREKLAQFVEGARGRLTEIVGCFKEKTKGGQSPDMTPLRKELDALASILAPAGEAAASAQAGQPGPASAAAAPKVLSSAESASISGEIRTREQVARTLDLICAYYQRYEPSSPLPFLLRRARRLVDSNFLEVMADLAPDALSQIRLATGAEETEKN